jgi:ATP-dependent helicase/nuclease subunit A
MTSLGALTIYKASAGSGKTHALIREYLHLIMQHPAKFKSILAVTFTNKATAEMKQRILSELHALAEGGDSSFRNEFLEGKKYNEEKLRKTAKIILELILHDYSRFHVETIDSFFQRVIRSFAREIHLQAAYNIELDDSRVLEEAVDRLLFEADQDKFLCDWLTRFADSKVQDGLHWNLKNDILRFSQELSRERFRESSAELIRQLEDRESINRYESSLFKYEQWFENHLKDIGESAVRIINDSGLTPDDFYNKDRGPAGFLLKLSKGIMKEPGNSVIRCCDNPDAWYSKSSHLKAEINRVYESGLNHHLKEIINFWNKYYFIYNSVKYTRQFIYSLGILTDISKKVIEYLNERNLFLLSDAAYFLKEIIGDNEAPFIYEKIGNYFSHYMIDEFQDTSRMQWQNFRPLLVNSLAGNMANLVVGDVKQSIYRWRNSDWEILSEGIENEFSRNMLEVRSLDKNYRSNSNIIWFNNLLFQSAREMVAGKFESINEFTESKDDLKDRFKKAYSDVIQKLPFAYARQGGYVEVAFLTGDDNKTWQDQADEKVVKIIMKLQDNGYEPRDIAILVRKHDEGKRITEYLLSCKTKSGNTGYSFDLISNELLYLTGSSAIRLIVSVMKYLVDPQDRINRAVILNEHLRYLKHDTGSVDHFDLFQAISSETPEKFSEYLPAGFNSISDEFRYFSLVETSEWIIHLFKLNERIQELPYIQAFQDVLLDYTTTGPSDINSFLQWWDDYGSDKSLSTSDDQNAIRVMTIHKAKGLQFRAVIVPYCDWNLDHNIQPILWCKPNLPPFNELVMVPVRYSSGLQNTIFRDEYRQERFRIHVDNLNLLYVAFTRARESLFVMAPYEPEKYERVRNISDLLGLILTGEKDDTGMIKCFNKVSLTWSTGEVEQIHKEEKKIPTTTYITKSASNIQSKIGLRVRWHGKDFLDPDAEKKVNYGKFMHEILQYMNTLEDLDPALNKVLREGKLNHTELESVKSEIMEFLHLDPVKDWFSGKWKVYNERDILMSDGHIRRPDRVMIMDDEIVVIDYKFGVSRLREYQLQMSEYITLIRKMGYRNVKGYLCYVKNKEVILITD